MGNPVVHWELMSKEPQKVASFYAGIFGWKVEHRPEINYRIVDTPADRRRVVEAGGRIHVERQEVPGMGAFSLFTDPEGRLMGLWQSAGS